MHPFAVCLYRLCARFVQTDMGNSAARLIGMDEATMKLDDSVLKIVELLDTATRDQHSGKYLDVSTGTEVPW